MDLLYAIRKFEICVMIFVSKTCQLCNLTAIMQGVYMQSNGEPKIPEQTRKFIYKKVRGIWYFCCQLGPMIQ